VIRIDEVEANKRVMMTRQKIIGGKSLEIAFANKQKQALWWFDSTYISVVQGTL
jgi:hypothetical protein